MDRINKTDDMLETALTALYIIAEWDCEFDKILSDWRKLRGEDGMAQWEWYSKELDSGECYDFSGITKEAAISDIRTSLGNNITIELIEARCWNDMVEGDEYISFAKTRNHQIIAAVDIKLAESEKPNE